jgi:hypothetical protein
MKKIFTLLCLISLIFSLQSFALVDTDADGVADESDICPRVYARSTNGCPTLAPSRTSVSSNICLESQKKAGKMLVFLTPICDTKTKVCPNVSSVTGVQSCDPIFPVILDPTAGVLVRGGIYIVDLK